ncbi:DUF692 domain-containing protein [Vibrio olivae]|uniref:DUF692 domain-containing protein n=1 Tax=Vibrio olivae TaxID=1243002 RepID=A0ABV5HSW3_9VIBR
MLSQHCALSPYVGVGLRTPHLDYFAANPETLSWLEIHSENYFQPQSPARKKLNHIAQSCQISCHGIGLSLGSVERVNHLHLVELTTLLNDIQPIFVSDHLSWSQQGGHYYNDLLPLPYTEEALDVFCRNVLEVQDAIKRPLLIENPSSYLTFNHSTINEWTFLNHVQQRTDCRLLLDINNIYVSAFNHQFDPLTYLQAINAQAVDEIHLAGFSRQILDSGEIWIDTHDRPVCEDVWQWYHRWIKQFGPRHTLIEWDTDIPRPEVLLEQAAIASQMLTPLTAVNTMRSTG